MLDSSDTAVTFNMSILINSDTDEIDTIAQVEKAGPDSHAVTQLVDQFIQAKRITYNQYRTLSKVVLADGTVDEQERCQINRLFDAIQSGAIRIAE